MKKDIWHRIKNKPFFVSVIGLASFSFFSLFFIVLGSAQEKKEGAEKVSVSAGRPEKASPEDLAAGKTIFFRKCVWCHGPTGAGDGPGADRLWPRPRNFNAGTFKIRHTASGELPTEEDLFLTVTHGLPGSAMPPWDGILSDKERMQVVRFVRTELVKDRNFLDKDTEDYHIIDFGKQIPTSKESIEKGKLVFTTKGKCVECHGNEGRGDGNKTQKDEWGFPILPADLHKCWNFRGNREDPYNPRNIFREVSTGLNGTPMPSFADVLTQEDRWNVANFVISLCPPKKIDPLTAKPVLQFVVKSGYDKGEIPSDINDPKWAEAESTYVGLAGQITEKPRNFVRLVDEVWVRSIYNDKEIAYYFDWDDRNKSVGQPETGNYELQPADMSEVPPAGQPVAVKGADGWPIYNDSIGIQFPAKWEQIAPPEKPRFIFGDEKNPVDLWKWDATGGIVEYTGKGITNPLTPRDEKNVKVVASEYKDGHWRVILKRDRLTNDKDNEVQFTLGQYIPTSFYIWDGNNGDRGAKTSISTWYYTILKPPVPKNVYVVPPIVVLVVIGFEFWLRKKFEKNKK
ncbi:MAG: c-type cytochrome [Nitrospiria bacterium]